MDGDSVLAVLDEAAAKVAEALAGLEDWGPAGTRPGQYRCDLVADEAAVPVLLAGGLGVHSEESGSHEPQRSVVAVLDPVDGSTNASRGLGWYGTSICAVQDGTPLAGLVRNQASGVTHRAVQGKGASRDGTPIVPSGATALASSVLGLSDWPQQRMGWAQFRSLGASALDLCAVADGTLDAFVDCGTSGHYTWDYLAAMLICTEAGAAVGEVQGRQLLPADLDERRLPVAAATRPLLDELLTKRRQLPN